MFRNIIILITLLTNMLLATPTLEMFNRLSSSDGGPDSRGAIWYDDTNNNIFVADYHEGLWKINECSNSYGDTTSKDNGIWDIGYSRDHIFAVGKSGLFIYDEDGNYINSLNTIHGEGLYVKGDYAYIINAKDGITIVNVEDINNPFIVDTVMKDKKFSQIRGGQIKQKVYFLHKEVTINLLYVSSLDGKLYLIERSGSRLYYKDDVDLFPDSEARKIFAGKDELIYVNSNFGELAVVKIDKDNLKLNKVGSWSSSDNHGSGQQAPAAGGVFVQEIKDGDSKKLYALITAANGNSDGYLYWLDVTDPSSIKQVDALHDSEESYGFNDIWVNDTKIYLAAHDGFCFMGMNDARNIPRISIQDSDGTFKEDINITQNADDVNDTKTFYVKIENKDDANKLNLKLKAPASISTWRYNYFDGDVEITDEITEDQGYEKEDVEPHDVIEIKIEITPISESATDTIVTIVASNKESKDICGKAYDSDEVSAKVTFKDKSGEAFSCDGNAYIFTSHSSKNNPTDVYVTDLISGNFDKVAEDINPTNINAIGYNTIDNYIWGYDKVTEEVKRVDKNYNIISFEIDKLPKHGYHAGDVSTDGILYLYSKFFDDGIKIYKVDVNPKSSTYLKMVGEIQLSKKIYTSDFAFHPKDNKIYYAGNTNLFRIDPESAKIEDLGSLGLEDKKIFVGAFFDNNGYFYAQENSGIVYKIDITDPSHPNSKAEKFSSFDVTSYSDGARCFKSPLSPLSSLSPLKFNVWDKDESIDNQIIKTKIVGEDINLTFASLNKNGTDFKSTDAKNIKIALFANSDQLTIWHGLVLETATHMDTTFSNGDFAYYHHQHEAFKDVKVVIKYEDNDGITHNIDALDHFAIRPESYNLSLAPKAGDTILKAGKDFDLIIKALDKDGNLVANYQEDAIVYQISSKEVDSKCKNGVLQVSNVNFVSGKASLIGKYSEVGKIDLNVSEISSKEYALIDNSDGSDRFISIGESKNNSFAPTKISVVWSLKDANVLENMTYYSHDAMKIGAPLYIKVTATDGSSLMENFSNECYAEDIHVKTHFKTQGVGTATLSSSSKIVDGNQSGKFVDFTSSFVAGDSGNFSYDINRTNFIKGKATQTANINFDRDQREVLEPMKFIIDDLNITTDKSAIVYNSGLVDKRANFFYARANAPTQTSKNKVFNAKVFYEVYCKNSAKSDFGLEDNEESKDSIYWYIVDDNIFFDFDDPEIVYKKSGVTLSKLSSSKIEISATKLPHQNIITYAPKSYLIYNMFNASATTHKFKVEQFISGKEWAGKGEVGLTVDTKASPMGYQKMDW